MEQNMEQNMEVWVAALGYSLAVYCFIAWCGPPLREIWAWVSYP